MAAPPLDAGAFHDTVDEVAVLEVTVTPVADPGTVAGVAGADAAEATLLPTEFVAVTVKV